MDRLDFAVSSQDLESYFLQQKECYTRHPYPEYSKRIKALRALRAALITNQANIISAINKDFGFRPAHETKILELFPSLQAIDHAIVHLKSWIKIRKIKTSKWFWPSRSCLLPIPRGVVGIMAPWNYPLFLVMAPLVSALAAGNRVMLKLSEHAPNIAALLKKMLSEIFIDSKVTVILGDAQVAAKFSMLPFDHLFFTGSTANGIKVMQAASSHLTSVTLELGGKSPAILLHDEIQADYIYKILLGKVMNAGQTCIAPDYLWLPRGLNSTLLELCKAVWGSNFHGQKTCSIINQQQYDRIIALINQAIQQGGRWHPFEVDSAGNWHSADNNGYRISVGLLLNANHTMDIMQHEIFGPVLPVMEYDTFDQLLNIMQIIPRPLAMYLFTEKTKNQELFATNTISGALCFNNTIVHAAQENLPFGGIGNSGMGCYRGSYGFETFSYLKPIYRQSKLNIFKKFYPPNKWWSNKLLSYMLK